ncbi:TRAP transporter small permease [Rhodobacteraceae bacterium LMO-12]|nr:TRAP transporter small permease [Rhodobacteraceae bacterium LMO-JJ12]
MSRQTIGSKIRLFFDSVENMERFLITVFTLGVGVIILYEIVLRNLGMQGLKWIDELGRIMLITTTLIGSSIAVRHKDHMIMDALYSVLGNKSARLLRSLTFLIAGVFYIYLAYYSADWTMRLMRYGRTMQTINLPAYLSWIVISIAIASMGLRYLFAAFRELTSEPVAETLEK